MSSAKVTKIENEELKNIQQLQQQQQQVADDSQKLKLELENTSLKLENEELKKLAQSLQEQVQVQQIWNQDKAMLLKHQEQVIAKLKEAGVECKLRFQTEISFFKQQVEELKQVVLEYEQHKHQQGFNK